MTVEELTLIPFKKMEFESEAARENEYWKFKAFYDQDYIEIVKYLKRELLEKPFSQATLDRMIFAHIDIIGKTLNRKIAGIYTKSPVRELVKGESSDENLGMLLKKSRYNQQIKEAFKRSEFYNTVAMQFVFRNDNIDIDIITPESFRVIPNEFNYLKADGIVVRKVNVATGEIYNDVWTDNENYIVDENGNERQGGENNPNNVNPYGRLPFVFLRKKDGIDFYGEPNWNLLRNQIAVDIKISDNDNAEYFNKYKIGIGIDTNFVSGQRLTPGMLLQTQSKGDKTPSFQIEDFSIDFDKLNDVVENRIKMALMSEGLPESSSSASGSPKQVGSKIIDEIELQETRRDIIEKLGNFEIEALETLRVVNNYHSTTQNKLPILNDGEFSVKFQEYIPQETPEDKTKRREYEQKFLGKDEIDFVMEDLGLNEDEAVKYIEVRKTRGGVKETGSLLDRFKKNA